MASFHPQPRHRIPQPPPLGQELGILLLPCWGDTVVFPDRPPGGLPLVLLGVPLLAQPPEQGIDGALLGVGEPRPELAQEGNQRRGEKNKPLFPFLLTIPCG